MSVLPTNTSLTSAVEPSPAPSPVPNPVPALPRRRSGLNARQQKELSKAREVLTALRNSDYAAALAAHRDVTLEEVNEFEQSLKAAEASGTATEGARPRRKTSTAREAAVRKKLLECLREIQTAARRVYRRREPARLEAYKIGESLDQNRALLEGFATNLIQQALTDNLSGWPAESRARAQECVKAYQTAQGDQTSASSRAQSLTSERDAHVADVVARRIELQLAADNEWPSSNPANAAIRREFKIPAHRPLNR